MPRRWNAGAGDDPEDPVTGGVDEVTPHSYIEWPKEGSECWGLDPKHPSRSESMATDSLTSNFTSGRAAAISAHNFSTASWPPSLLEH